MFFDEYDMDPETVEIEAVLSFSKDELLGIKEVILKQDVNQEDVKILSKVIGTLEEWPFDGMEEE